VKGCTAFSRDNTEEFVRFAEANEIKPVIAKTFEFDEMVEAFEALQKQNAVGKLVVKISSG
jgi:D-arabinose 1-dehydrogenase-like Zn-dependent alcohol dehydrogenase